MANNIRSAVSKSSQSLTHTAKAAQELADQAMGEADPEERVKIIEELLSVLESDQSAEALLDSAA